MRSRKEIRSAVPVIIAFGVGLGAYFLGKPLLQLPTAQSPVPSAKASRQTENGRPPTQRRPSAVQVSEAKTTSPTPLQKKIPVPDRASEEAQSGVPSTSPRDPYAHLPVLSSKETPIGRDGTFSRIRVVRSELKYPLIRVEERFIRDANSGEDQLTQRIAMVADHLLLRLEDGYTEKDLESLSEQLGMKIRKSMPASRLYLIAFEGSDVDALDKSLEKLQAARIVRQPEPDYLVRN